MAHKVGSKGQVVIAKEIRDLLGVEPGWQAIQIPTDDHVKLYFVPPPHNRSLAGCLAKYVNPGTSLTADRWDEARQAAWDEAARGEFGDTETTP